ncbi:hypothetical protein Msil_3197 [Methylocella silvestris BL2]|uniref:Uncharacterized protein n=1 Tax=Methylocella silvestris (strain DSM 15510 / CIP 108128 / LMG 27833 / NCIMB 13906 / BL2) TaxID=395965 RepID=B8EMH6_METSB|nr:hypothetical protein Msil_3197 [Methylocella silvestris BL2]
MGRCGSCVGEDRLITLLAIARRDDIPQTAGLAVKRAAKHWRSGDRALAAIHLAQIGLRKIDEDDAERLALAAALVDAGMSARELARELGLNVQSGARKYSDDQPRVPAGNGRASGQWASGEGGAGEAPVVEGRSAISGRWRAVGGVNRVKDLPKDAVVVKRPDGSAVEDSESTTGKLMAPPRQFSRDLCRRQGDLCQAAFRAIRVRQRGSRPFWNLRFSTGQGDEHFLHSVYSGIQLCCRCLHGGGRI